MRVQITLPEDAEAAEDLLSGLLPDLGATGVEYLQAPRRLRATFRTAETAPVLQLRVTALIAELGLEGLTVEASVMSEQEWAPYWQSAFEPLRFGPLAILPSWAAEPDGAQFTLRIDPSQAFGTGLHPTTALCLDWLVGQPELPAMLDVGTGTGVLSMAARMLGAPSTTSLDIDPVAIEAARHAIADNAVEGIDLRLGSAGDVDGTFRLALANVRPAPLLEMASALQARVAPGGRLILCGMRSDEVSAVQASYEARGFSLDGQASRDDWVRLDLQRQR